MTQTKYKFKAGDLVQYRDKDLQFMYGIGIIIVIGPKQTSRGPTYDIYWSKIGLDWDFEDCLEKVSK